MSLISTMEKLGRPVAYYPSIAKALGGDPSAAIFLCQFIYWRSKVGDREIYKSREEILEETGLGVDAQKRICAKLKRLKLVTIIKKGLPARNYYIFNWENVGNLLVDTTPTSEGEMHRLDRAKTTDNTELNTLTTSEITTKTTTEITTEITAKIADSAQSAHEPMPEIPISKIEQSEPSTKPKKTKTTLGVENLIADYNVTEQVANDWLAVRKAKRAPLTKTALAAIEREAAKARITVAAAIEYACEAGWIGFKAEWHENRELQRLQHNYSPSQQQETAEQRAARYVAEYEQRQQQRGFDSAKDVSEPQERTADDVMKMLGQMSRERGRML